MTALAWVEDYQALPGHYDEFVDAQGSIRPHWQAAGGALAAAAALPLLFEHAAWRLIESGVAQRARLLEALVADSYGQQRLCRDFALPASAITRSMDFLRPLCGVAPAGGRHIIAYAVDLGRACDGRWHVLHDRTQAPSGLGHVLRLRTEALRNLGGRPGELAPSATEPFFRSLETVLRSDQQGDGCLWTPGPFNENYDEHRLLARQLDMRLVEGGDLLVQRQKLYVRTIAGLEAVSSVLRRLDGAFADPLTLNAQSRLGVPGLTQVLRAGNLVMANSLGAGLAEAASLQPHLDAAARNLLGEELQLRQRAGGPFALSTMPVSEDGRWWPRPLSLRVFAVQERSGWQVMPGGICQFIEPATRAHSCQHDVWVCRPPGPVIQAAVSASRVRRLEPLMSRIADHLFWFGRYVERASAIARVLHALETRLATELPSNGWSETMDLAQLLAAWGATPYTGAWDAAQIAASAPDHLGNLPWLINAASSNASGAGGYLPAGIAGAFEPLKREFGAQRLERFATLQLRLDRIAITDQPAAFLVIGRHLERAISGARLAMRFGVGPASHIEGSLALAMDLRSGGSMPSHGQDDTLFNLLVSRAGESGSVARDLGLILTALQILPPPAPPGSEFDILGHAALARRCQQLAVSVASAQTAAAALPALEEATIRLGEGVMAGYLLRRDRAPDSGDRAAS